MALEFKRCIFLFVWTGAQALVTGGASGIGAATCRALHAAGAAVTIADIDQTGAEALARELPGASVLILDITDEAAVQSAFARIAALDILVNNAGIGLVGGVEQTELADFERLFRVNVTWHVSGDARGHAAVAGLPRLDCEHRIGGGHGGC